MIQEEKELLFKDLCARLPYHTRVKVWLKDGTTEEGALDLEHNYGDVLRDAFYYDKIVKIKPYLFPLSSITEAQKEEYCSLQQKVIYNNKGLVNSDTMEYVNWCYKNHIDINNLIPMGLAINATNLNIY